MSREVTIGIDLGTSNSCVASLLEDRPRVLANAYGEPTTASVVAFGQDGSIAVGNQAKARVILDPTHTVSSAKRLIGRYYFSEEVKKAKAVHSYEIVSGDSNSVRIQIREETFSLPEISAFVLKEMKSIAEANLNVPVTRAVITVPAFFNDNQRQATKDAGRIAGLEVLRILNEPTAAALAYGYGRDLRQKVAVYDLGGGTFDVSVLEIGEEVFEVLATCGDTYLGGDDFDDRLIDVLAELVQKQHGVNVRTDPFALEKLKAAAEQAKIELSSRDPAQIKISGLATIDDEPIGIEYELTREQFSQLTRDLIFRTFKVCDEALQEAGLTVRDLDGVILVGGPTRLPSIRGAVKEYFQREPEVDINPDEVVALGAAIHANSLVTTADQSCLLDVTPLSLRLGIAGGMAETIIHRNSPIPIDHTRIFTTAQDDQAAVSVRIYQGESREADGNTALGEFQFSGYQPGPRGQVQIEVQFAISTEGIVKVSARDPKTGAAHSATVSMSSGLSEQEIQEILAQARARDVARPDRRAPAPQPEPSAAEVDDTSEYLELPPIDERAPADAADASAPPANSVFQEMPEDLALPDEAETRTADNRKDGPAPEFDATVDIGDLCDEFLSEAETELAGSDEAVLGGAEPDDVLLDRELKK
ncbi:MAG: molecular chaperone DnaK [Deltaproteobacteria bacterium]|nr:molecular chaperone DnaK [Deltaproteobacteria bacterium]